LTLTFGREHCEFGERFTVRLAEGLRQRFPGSVAHTPGGDVADMLEQALVDRDTDPEPVVDLTHNEAEDLYELIRVTGGDPKGLELRSALRRYLGHAP
jgi:hypothetical protein